MEYTEKLKSFPLLSTISGADLDDFVKLLKPFTFSAGTDIITEGDTGADMYFLMSGSVEIIRRTIFGDSFVCASLSDEEHSVFGEMALIDSDRRSATVRAVTDCATLAISRDEFTAYTESHPAAGVRLLRFISIHLVRNIRTENDNLNLVYQALIEEIESN